MTVTYLSKEEKRKFYEKYPFLKDVIKNENIISIKEVECDDLPPPQDDYSYLGTDWYFYHSNDFEDSQNIYRVYDTNFQLDLDNDKPIMVSDHEFTIYKKSKNFIQSKKRLVVVSGPSGVGKDPIIKWVKKLYVPALCQVKVRKTKTERHKGDESDIGFGGNDGEYYQFDCRGTEQRIYLDELDKAIEEHDTVLLETYYKAFDFLKSRYGNSVDFASTFVSPLNAEEIKELIEQGKRLEDHLPELMLDSIVRRAERDGKAFTHSLVKELEQRAEDSVNEMRFAHNYRYVIPNHCYESDSRWRFAILIGEPRKVVDSLHKIIQTGNSDYAGRENEYLDIINLEG
ncbi:MAG: hypothetical protein ABH824_00815 [Nanoarchaeota archaeon]